MKKFSELRPGKQFITGVQEGIAPDVFLKLADHQLTPFVNSDCKQCVRPNSARLADGSFHLFSPDTVVIELHTW